jgi:ADP-heptose:LPS heptosyltransferase
MRPDLMRLLDRAVGIPACFVLGVLLRVRQRLAGDRVDSAGPRRILFIGLAEIGALVVAHSAVQHARRRFPDADLYFLTFTAGGPILRLMGFPDDRIFVLDPSSPLRLIRDVTSTLRRIRGLSIDATVNLEIYVRFGTILAALSGAQRRAAFHRFHEEGHYLGNLSTHRLVYSPHHHAAHAYMALVDALVEAPGAQQEPRSKRCLPAPERLRLSPAPADRLAVRRKLDAQLAGLGGDDWLVILNVNAGDLVVQRRWPLENYIELARRFLEEPRVVIVLTGTAVERGRVDEVAARIGGSRVVNLAGETTLAELIALFDTAALLITNDSGPAHFASTTDVPTIVLFGPETPRIFGPLGPAQEVIYLGYACSPCVSVYNQKRSPCGDNRCLKDIGVDMVFAAAQRHLRRRPAASSPA